MHHSNRSFLSKHYEHGSHKDKPMESSEMWDFLLHSFFVPNIQQFIEQTELRWTQYTDLTWMAEIRVITG